MLRHELLIPELLAGPGVHVLAEAPEGLVGFLDVVVRPDGVEGAKGPVPFLEAWYVTRSRRGQGIGRSLMHYAERWAAGQGYQELASSIPLHHSLAMHLHQRFGFQEVGRTVHFLKPLSALEPPKE